MSKALIDASGSYCGILRILGALKGLFAATLTQGLGVEDAEKGLTLGVGCRGVAAAVPLEA